MKNSLKAIIIAAILLVFSSVTYGIYHAFEGNYFHNASFITSALLLLFVAILFILGYNLIKHVWTLSLVFIVISSVGCDYAKSNQQVLVSTDCGMNWKLSMLAMQCPKEQQIHAIRKL